MGCFPETWIDPKICHSCQCHMNILLGEVQFKFDNPEKHDYVVSTEWSSRNSRGFHDLTFFHGENNKN